MKRILLILASLAMLFVTGCKKHDKVDPEKPTLTWESNPTFAQRDITKIMDDATVIVNAPNGIQTLTVTLRNCPPLLLGIVQQKAVGTAVNKSGANAASPVLDLIDDATCVNYLKSLKILGNTSIRGSKSMALNLSVLVNDLISGLTLENGTLISFEIAATDASNASITKTATFRSVPAPTLSWKRIGVVEPLTFTDTDSVTGCDIHVYAPGKIGAAHLTIATSAATFLTQISAFHSSTANPPVVDLIGDAQAVKSFPLIYKIPAGTDLEDKTEVDIDFSTLVQTFVLTAGNTSELVLTLHVADKNGYETTQPFRFKYTK